MPANGLNSGIDVKITYTDADGVRQFAILESFSVAEKASVPEKTGIDGLTYFPKFHPGWGGTFTYLRTNNVLDKYIALEEAGFFLGADQLPGTIHHTITEIDKSITQIIYTNVVLVLEDAGTWTGTEVVTQRVTWYASRRQFLT